MMVKRLKKSNKSKRKLMSLRSKRKSKKKLRLRQNKRWNKKRRLGNWQGSSKLN
jgi:hypothetical protein